MEVFLFLSAVTLVSSERVILTDYGVSAKDVEQIISEHSNLRNRLYTGYIIGQPSAKGMNYLKYDHMLAKEAQDLANACVPIPQKRFNYNLIQHGESTLYMRSTKRRLYNKWIDALQTWFSYHPYFDFDKDPLPNQVPYFEISADFNERVGCGYAQCRIGCSGSTTEYHNVFVCRYGRKKTYTNEVPYQRSDRCKGICDRWW